MISFLFTPSIFPFIHPTPQNSRFFLASPSLLSCVSSKLHYSCLYGISRKLLEHGQLIRGYNP